MLSQTLTIARNTFLESVRQPIYFILTAICGLAVLFTYWTAAFSMEDVCPALAPCPTRPTSIN